jgi:hypothetical protein
MIIFNREKNLINIIFADKNIRRNDEFIDFNNYEDENKDFYEYLDGKMINFVKNNSYHIAISDNYNGKGMPLEYFFRKDKLKKEFKSLDDKIKEFFTNDYKKYGEYCILKQYKQDLAKKSI